MRYPVLIFFGIFSILPTSASADNGAICSALRAATTETQSTIRVGPGHPGTDYLADARTYLFDKNDPLWQTRASKIFSLSPREKADLTEKARHQSFGPFEPNCNWSVRVSQEILPRLHFSQPLVSSDGNLVFVGVDKLEPPRYGGGGSLCLIRKVGADWNARCIGTWVA